MTSSSACGFMVLHSNQLEGLRDLLVEVLRRDPLPPLASEVLLVQSNGMRHWLEIALAEQLGICAATEITLPATKLWQLYRQVLGAVRVRAHMPLDKAPLLWRLQRGLPALLAQDEFAPLARYLGSAPATGATNSTTTATTAVAATSASTAAVAAPDAMRLYQLAQQLADVLDGYQNYRADWLDDWAQGRDQLRDRHGQPQPLPAPQQWQAALWRHLLRDLDDDAEPVELQSRNQVHTAFLDALQRAPEGQPLPGLPRRLIVFGVSALPMQTVEALAALGRVCQVLMFVHNPSQHHWGDLVESHTPLRQWARQRQAHKTALPVRDAQQGFDDLTRYQLHTEGHPLLAAWGKQGRDYLHALDRFDDVARYRALFQRVDVFVDPCAGVAAPHQLAQLQSAILQLEATPQPPRALTADDDSLCFVQTHGAQREVEVLHDRLLGWLDADPSLQPDDIMVMVPDMARFAPHIHAVFGRFAAGDLRHLPYAVADQGARDEPLVQVLEQLLQLPQLRITQREWRRWFDVAPLRQRFGLDADDVADLARWLDTAGVRWGLDAAHRAQRGVDAGQLTRCDGDAEARAARGMDVGHLAEHRSHRGLHAAPPDTGQNSWLFGLERLLLGYAQGRAPQDTQDDLWHDVLASPGVGGQDGPRIHGLLAWLRAVQTTRDWLSEPHTPAEWVQGLQTLLADFFLARTDAETRLIERVLDPLASWLAQCELARLDTPLPLAVVREHWLAQLQQPALHKRFFGGGVQFATLLPMRTIPYRIVCLLGMNDADYPRRQTPRDFDLMTAAPLWRPGDRARRDDDRYLFLEAVLSARERLYVSWQGRETTTHAELPPSVLVAQLREHLNQGWTPARDAPLQALQPFSPRYFAQGGPRTYADDWQAARARTGAVHATPTVSPPTRPSGAIDATHAPRPWRDTAHAPEQITLDQLKRLLRQPVEVYFRERLRLTLQSPEAQTPEDEPFALDRLDEYRLVSQIAQADDADAAVQRLRLGGALALGGFGPLQARSLAGKGQELHAHGQAWLTAWPEVLPPQQQVFTFDASPASFSSPSSAVSPASSMRPASPNGPTLQASWAHQPQPLWRVRDDRWLQLQWRAGNVLQGEKGQAHARIDTLTSLWLNHLVACASGHATTSVQIGLDAQLRLDPLATDVALAHLHDLVELWRQAWQAPLLVPRKTACAWLLARQAHTHATATATSARAAIATHADTERDAAPDLARDATQDPNAAARAVFEGDFRRNGEWAEEPALQRLLPEADYDALTPALQSWAERLYGPLRDAVRILSHKAAQEAAASHPASPATTPGHAMQESGR